MRLRFAAHWYCIFTYIFRVAVPDSCMNIIVAINPSTANQIHTVVPVSCWVEVWEKGVQLSGSS